jgi:hypothetical protein
MFFSNFREPVLGYLRNLTPQALLLSIAIIMGMKIDFTKWDLANTSATLSYFGVMGTFMFALTANMMKFIEDTCRSIKKIDDAAIELKKSGVKGIKYWYSLGKLLLQQSKFFLVEYFVAMIVVNVGFLAVFVVAVQSATNLYNSIHGIR